MPRYAQAFWAMTSFLAGVFVAEMFEGRGALIVWLVTLLAIALCSLLQRRALILFLFSGAIGFSYYVIYINLLATPFTAPLGRQDSFVGIVQRVAKTTTGQQIDISLKEDYEGVVRLYTESFPMFSYGDILSFSGTIKPPTGESMGYFKKEGIGGVVSYPQKVTIEATGQGTKLVAFLYRIRDSIRATFERFLPGEQATLMTGLVIGKSSGFSKEFTEKLKTTGTTHLVALSGYNIATILTWFSGLFGMLVARRRALWLAVLAVIAFVVMTGAEASVVRAAIMATIMVLAEQIERPYVVRSAIVVTALAMILANPHVLVFDIGFQLSFAALIGIIVIKPALDLLLLKNRKSKGVLSWREHLTTTLAAQIAVLPILLFHFGFVTPIGVITNVLLLSFIPLTMVFGVALLIVSLVVPALSFFIAIPARALLSYELGVIELFSRIEVGYEIGETSFLFIALYYAALAGGILLVKRRHRGFSDEKKEKGSIAA